MVRNAIRLMEILSFLYMVAAAYNVKLKYNIYAVVFVISELFLLSGINDYGFSSYLLGFSYLIMFLVRQVKVVVCHKNGVYCK